MTELVQDLARTGLSNLIDDKSKITILTRANFPVSNQVVQFGCTKIGLPTSPTLLDSDYYIYPVGKGEASLVGLDGVTLVNHGNVASGWRSLQHIVNTDKREIYLYTKYGRVIPNHLSYITRTRDGELYVAVLKESVIGDYGLTDELDKIYLRHYKTAGYDNINYIYEVTDNTPISSKTSTIRSNIDELATDPFFDTSIDRVNGESLPVYGDFKFSLGTYELTNDVRHRYTLIMGFLQNGVNLGYFVMGPGSVYIRTYSPSRSVTEDTLGETYFLIHRKIEVILSRDGNMLHLNSLAFDPNHADKKYNTDHIVSLPIGDGPLVFINISLRNADTARAILRNRPMKPVGYTKKVKFKYTVGLDQSSTVNRFGATPTIFEGGRYYEGGDVPGALTTVRGNVSDIRKSTLLINTLMNFKSDRDPGVEKYVLPTMAETNEFVHWSDTDIYITYKSGTGTHGLYYGFHTKEHISQVSSHHIGISTAEVQRLVVLLRDRLVDIGVAVDNSKFAITTHVKEDAVRTHILAGKSNMHIFASLPESIRIRALAGENGFKRWTAKELENSSYMKAVDTYDKNFRITDDMAKDILGYDGLLELYPSGMTLPLGRDIPKVYRGTSSAIIHNEKGVPVNTVAAITGPTLPFSTEDYSVRIVPSLQISIFNIDALNAHTNLFPVPANTLVMSILLTISSTEQYYLVEDIDYVVSNGQVILFKPVIASTFTMSIYVVHEDPSITSHVKYHEVGFLTENGFYSADGIHLSRGHTDAIIGGGMFNVPIDDINSLGRRMLRQGINKPYMVRREYNNFDSILGNNNTLSEYQVAASNYREVQEFLDYTGYINNPPKPTVASADKYKLYSTFMTYMVIKVNATPDASLPVNNVDIKAYMDPYIKYLKTDPLNVLNSNLASFVSIVPFNANYKPYNALKATLLDNIYNLIKPDIKNRLSILPSQVQA